MLGAFIRSQRTMAELSQRQLAEMTNVSNAYLSQLERGLHQPSLRVLSSIAQALQIPVDEVLRQAGLISHNGAGQLGHAAAARMATVEAIASDEELSPDDRAVLIRLYEAMRASRARPEARQPETKPSSAHAQRHADS